MKVKYNSNQNYEIKFKDAPKEIIQAFRKAMFDQREQLENTLPYQKEKIIHNHIKNGNLEELKAYIKDLSKQDLYMGKLSNDPLRQTQYNIIAGLAVATRSAIEGGLSEIEAYNLSDVYIQKIDIMTNSDEIGYLYIVAICDFAKRVQKIKARKKVYSYAIALCIEYIHSHLHYPITLFDLAKVCKLTPQYLSGLFKKETGYTPMNYILEEKLETSKQMLTYSEYTLAEIANYLAFCSHSNFTEHFRKHYGITPREYRDRSRTYRIKEDA